MKNLLLAAFLIVTLSAHGITVTSGSVPISIAGSGTHTNQQLVQARNGLAMAIWVEAFPNRVEASYFNGTSWLFRPILTTNGTVVQGSFPQTSINVNGSAHAVWLNTTNNQILTSQFNPQTTTWSFPQFLSLGGTNAAPQIAVNSSGNALAVWIQTNPQAIVAASFNASTQAWSLPTALFFGGVSFPLVTLDDANQGIVLWSGPSFTIETITVSVP